MLPVAKIVSTQFYRYEIDISHFDFQRNVNVSFFYICGQWLAASFLSAFFLFSALSDFAPKRILFILSPDDFQTSDVWAQRKWCVLSFPFFAFRSYFFVFSCLGFPPPSPLKAAPWSEQQKSNISEWPLIAIGGDVKRGAAIHIEHCNSAQRRQQLYSWENIGSHLFAGLFSAIACSSVHIVITVARHWLFQSLHPAFNAFNFAAQYSALVFFLSDFLYLFNMWA